MAYQGVSSSGNKVVLLARYKWEFLRRNPQFKNGWRELDRLRGAGLKSRSSKERWRIFLELVKRRKDFLKRWRFNWWDASSARSYMDRDPLLALQEPPFLAVLPDPAISPITKQWSRVNGRLRLKTLQEIKRTRWVTVRINLDASWSEINREIKETVDCWRKATGRERPRSRARNRVAVWDEYLQVYDLRKQGWSWARIGGKVYSACGREAIDRARKAHEACRKFVNGGYRKIKI